MGRKEFMTTFTYAEVGATRDRPLPPRYNHVRHRTMLGEGDEVFRRAADAVLTFTLHRRAGARIRTDAARAAPGVRLTVGLGPFTVPCEVVYTHEEPNRAGFGYGTLPGHQESGEEAFVVERDTQDRVWFTVVAFSRPARWPVIVAGPLGVLAQRGFARLLGRTLRRICTVKA
jgi:uncharacterized protein (UPF0548 family)